MQELSLIVAILVVFNAYLLLSFQSFKRKVRKEAMSASAEVTSKFLKKATLAIKASLSTEVTSKLNAIEGNIIAYIDHNTNIPVPAQEDK